MTAAPYERPRRNDRLGSVSFERRSADPGNGRRSQTSVLALHNDALLSLLISTGRNGLVPTKACSDLKAIPAFGAFREQSMSTAT
jgi:hypothetical protein